MSEYDENENGNTPDYKREHALEKFLNIEPTPIEKVKYDAEPLTKHEGYDKKDSEIEKQMQEVFIQSMEGYRNLENLLDAIEPKYRARMAEVALQYLKTSLDAANSKGKLKEGKDKLDLRQALSANKGGNNTTNVILSANRNELLRELRKISLPDIDGEIVEDPEDINEPDRT